MPALSPTMTAGNIGTWAKNPGDALHPGDVLVEIETDKAQMDFEFQDDGILAKVLVESGEKDVAVGNVSFLSFPVARVSSTDLNFSQLLSTLRRVRISPHSQISRLPMLVEQRALQRQRRKPKKLLHHRSQPQPLRRPLLHTRQ